MKELNKTSKKNNITFGVLFFIFFLIIGFYPIKFNAGNVRSKIVNDGVHEL